MTEDYPQGTSKVNPPMVHEQLHGQEALDTPSSNDRIRMRDVDLSDGISTETELFASGAGSLALDRGLSTGPLTSIITEGDTSAGEDPVNQKKKEWTRALDSLPETLRGILWSADRTWVGNFDPRKVVKLLPIVDTLGIEGSEEDKAVVLSLAEMTGCKESSYGASEEENLQEQKRGEEVISFLSELAERGFSIRGLLELTRTGSNMQKLMELHEQNPVAIDDSTSPLSLILRMADMPLHGLVPKDEDEKYYANGQGRELDVRDSVIATIIETAEYADSGSEYHKEARDRQIEYIAELESKLPQLQDMDFPLEMIGRQLLGRFNPSVRINIHDDEYETRIMGRCLQIGNRIRDLEAVDPTVAREAVFGQDDLTETIVLADTIEQTKQTEPKVYELFLQVKQLVWSVSGIKEISNCLAVSRGIVNSPALYELVKDEKIESIKNGPIVLPKVLNALVNMSSLGAYSDRSELFFSNCDSLSELIEDERIDTQRLLHAADSLDAEQMERFAEIMQDAEVQEAFDDPELSKHLNDSIYSIYTSLDAKSILRALEFVKSIDKKDYFPLKDIIDVASQRWSRGIKIDEPIYQDLLFSSLERAAKSADKDGYPYDSAEAVGSAVEFVIGRSKGYGNPDAVAQEMFEWFEASGLPYSALPTVVGFAEEAEKEGVSFEPMAVYEWIYGNPERIERVSAENLHAYVTRRLVGKAEEGKDAATIIAEAEAAVAEREESFRVLVNIRDSALQAAASKSGNLESIFDGVEMTDRGIGYSLRRSGVEIALGIRSLDSDAEHRVYGSCAFIDEGVPGGADGYGDIVLVFEPGSDALTGTTFTPEDSFHGVERLTAEDAMVLRHLKDRQGMGYRRTDEYVEAQIPGAVTLYDAEQIVVSSEEQAGDLRSILPPELAGKIVVRRL